MIPFNAKKLLDFIGDIEAPRGYDTIYGNNQNKLLTRVTRMSVDQILLNQRGWSSLYGSSATGRYQFMRATLRGLKAEMALSGNERFTPALQDKLGYQLLQRRGFNEFVAGQMSATAFGKNLAKEWASLPVLAATRGRHRLIKRGMSYYVGDKLNKALVHPAKVEAILSLVIGASGKKQRVAQGGIFLAVIAFLIYMLTQIFGD